MTPKQTIRTVHGAEQPIDELQFPEDGDEHPSTDLYREETAKRLEEHNEAARAEALKGTRAEAQKGTRKPAGSA